VKRASTLSVNLFVFWLMFWLLVLWITTGCGTRSFENVRAKARRAEFARLVFMVVR
jgi:hypothetical protein